MNPRTTGILAVVAAVLGAFVYLYEIEGERERQAVRDEAAQIHPGLEADTIEAVAFETLDGVAARFERQDGRWRLVSPFTARAEPSALDAIASALADLPGEGRLEGEHPLDAYGLGAEARRVRFEAGGEMLGLRIGRTTPVGGHRYVARLADDEVAYVESFRLNALNRNLADLRDRRILDFEAGHIAALEIEWPDLGAADRLDDPMADTFVMRFERKPSEEYRIVSPIRSEVDAEVVRDLLSDLAYLRASDFVDERTPEVEAALARTAIRFRWQLEGDEGGGGPAETGVVRVAGELGAGRRLVEGPEGALYTIPEDRLSDFPRRFDAYRFKRLSNFDLSAARSITLEFARQATGQSRAPRRLQLSLGESGWHRADGGPVDPAAVSELVLRLSNLSADERVADAMGEAELANLGLAPPQGRLVVEGDMDAEAPRLAELALGRMDPERGLFVRRADRETVFLLAPESVVGLPWSSDRWDQDFEAPEAPEAPESEIGE